MEEAQGSWLVSSLAPRWKLAAVASTTSADSLAGFLGPPWVSRSGWRLERITARAAMPIPSSGVWVSTGIGVAGLAAAFAAENNGAAFILALTPVIQLAAVLGMER